MQLTSFKESINYTFEVIFLTIYFINQMIAIIPARGGSKGLPGKNIKPLLNKPLIAYTIEAAKNSKYISRIIVSTDCEEISKTAIKYGAECPYLRPQRFSIWHSTFNWHV